MEIIMVYLDDGLYEIDRVFILGCCGNVRGWFMCWCWFEFGLMDLFCEGCLVVVLECIDDVVEVLKFLVVVVLVFCVLCGFLDIGFSCFWGVVGGFGGVIEFLWLIIWIFGICLGVDFGRIVFVVDLKGWVFLFMIRDWGGNWKGGFISIGVGVLELLFLKVVGVFVYILLRKLWVEKMRVLEGLELVIDCLRGG